ncbi:uncharacterized protein CPUR_05652 [Claviceps purpurea 20.1]|uniref:F-box domain-containing protein n=1 Tax=Claviceps purpurea (strain 20.1) TaxID=1111077 RepID=M1VWS8_CLAP2|nr:uncharacterized protein CPUR_05652 [Claviceps purpurea 20.1]
MDSAAREARLMAREWDMKESTCPMVLLPPEMKHKIMSYINTQQSLSRLGQTCRRWHGTATEELYTRDAKEHTSFAMKWMAANAVDEQTTDSAIRTLEVSRRWGGQIDAVKLDEAESGGKDQIMYHKSTALHIAVFLGNLRLTETLLNMGASLTIPCPALFWASMGSQQLQIRFAYFQEVFWAYGLGPDRTVFPILLAFLQSDTEMCKLLLEHGAGREAMIVYGWGHPKFMSILHFAAADPTTDYRQWQCLFDKFRKHIDEPCPIVDALTPLHVALRVGCTQGMQIAVETGADKEARNGWSHTPLSSAIQVTKDKTRLDHGTFKEFTRCFRKFVESGADINPEGDSALLFAVQSYGTYYPVDQPLTGHLIYVLLEYHADIHGTGRWQNTNMVNDIINSIFYHDSICSHDKKAESQKLLKELFSHLVRSGLDLRTPAPGLPSPLFRLLDDFTDHEWLIDLLFDNGATIHEHELDRAFICWCYTTKLWEKNKYDAWWLHQGREDKIFLQWCEHPYNVWWWQHFKQFSPHVVKEAYEVAFEHEDRHLYDILTHLPLPTPSDDVLIELAFHADSIYSWAWRLVLLCEFEDDFVPTWRPGGENMIHLTVEMFIGHERDYSAADVIQDISYLRDKGVDMTARNADGKTPLEILLSSGSKEDGIMEVAALLGGKEYKAQEPA